MNKEIKLLKHQFEFLNAKRNTLLVAGYGAGKSYAGTIKTIYMKMKYPLYKVAYYLPHYGLVRDVAFDKFPALLEEMKLKYKLNKSDKEISIENYGSIIFRSMDNPTTIVGYETAYSLIDEADILPMDKMTLAYNKILGRNRAVDNALVDAVSTPESFKWLYNASRSGNFKVIKARSFDNKHLPPDYIDTLREQYPDNLLKAYLEGEFVNLTSGTVYIFNREKDRTFRTITDNDNHLIIGQDFNIGGCCSVVYIVENNNAFAVDEFVSHDTFQVVDNIKKKYPNKSIEIIPDASGTKGQTNASKSDIQILKDAGFRINAPTVNPRVQDRINATNSMYHQNRLKINIDKCPNFTRSQEQQAYDKIGNPEKFAGAATVDDWNDAGTYPIARLFGINKTEIKRFDISYG